MKEFFIYNKAKEEKVFFSGRITIGRSSDCELSIDEKEVSTKHAIISIGGDDVFIEDFNSNNGTFVNGTRLEPKQKHCLHEKDIIQIGNHYLFFNSEEGNVEYVELPSFTGAFAMGTEVGIVHDKFENLEVKDDSSKYSLKGLRATKEKINEIKKCIEDLAELSNSRAGIEKTIHDKKSELNDFDNYFKMKKYRTEDDFLNTISSVERVNSKIGDEITEVEGKISALEEQVAALNKEINSLKKVSREAQSEFDNNVEVTKEIAADLEIFRGRDGLVNEIKGYMQKLKKMDELDIQKQMETLKENLAKEEEQLKVAQKQYAQKKFGSEGLFSKKPKKKSA